MSTPGVAVIGSYGVAFWITGAVPAAGETVLGRDFTFGNGGKGSNQAIGVARLGVGCQLLAAVGDDKFGHEARELWTAEGVDHHAVVTVPGVATMAGIIILDAAGENRIITDPGANAALTPDHVAAFGATIAGNVLVTQLEIPVATAAAALRLGRSRGMTTILNPAPAQPLPAAVLRDVDILTPNQSEARLLLGLAPDDPSPDESVAARLIELGVGTVVMTLGERGAAIVGADGVTLVPSHRVEVVDTTGAGDAFTGALAAALAEGLPIERAAARATAAGAFAVTRKLVVPALPDHAAIDTLLRGGTQP